MGRVLHAPQTPHHLRVLRTESKSLTQPPPFGQCQPLLCERSLGVHVRALRETANLADLRGWHVGQGLVLRKQREEACELTTQSATEHHEVG